MRLYHLETAVYHPYLLRIVTPESEMAGFGRSVWVESGCLNRYPCHLCGVWVLDEVGRDKRHIVFDVFTLHYQYFLSILFLPDADAYCL